MARRSSSSSVAACAGGLARGRVVVVRRRRERAAAQEVVGQKRDVVRPLAQQRQPDLVPPQTVIEVLPQRPAGKQLRGLAVQRGEDPDRDAAALGRAHRAHLAIIEHPQQLRLVRRCERLELIEDQHPAVRLQQQPVMIPVGPRERAAAVPEEDALEQIVRGGGAVVGHEGAVREPRAGVNRPGHQLLPGPGRPDDQHVHVGAGGARHVTANLRDRARGADDGVPRARGERARCRAPAAGQDGG